VRDLILLAAVLCMVALTLRTPIVGLLAWIWIALMLPQREAYTFMSGLGLNFYLAVLTVLSWAVWKERRVPPPNFFALALLVFGLWCSVTTYAAIDRDHAYVMWDRWMKSIVLALAVYMMADTRARVQAVLWAVVLSLGYYAVKGGLFSLATGGGDHVFGPEDSMIGDNNHLGLVLVCLLPLMNYLRLTTRPKITRLATLGMIACTFVAIVGTYSRGALLSLGAALAAYAVRSRSGIVLVLLAGVLASSLPAVLPAKWLDRMSTIQTANSDASFTGRVAAWKTSYAIASARPLGAGFSAVNETAIVQQFPTPGGLTSGRAAHSIYFQVLGDHGFVGLALYLVTIAMVVLNTFIVLYGTGDRPDLAWARQLARMLQVTMVAFLVGGAALSLAYYDGILVLMTLSACLVRISRQPAEALADQPAGPRWKRARAATPLAAATAHEATSPPVL
jgi:probable O-glycosylation ligase (exosortase A-associated)